MHHAFGAALDLSFHQSSRAPIASLRKRAKIAGHTTTLQMSVSSESVMKTTPAVPGI